MNPFPTVKKYLSAYNHVADARLWNYSNKIYDKNDPTTWYNINKPYGHGPMGKMLNTAIQLSGLEGEITGVVNHSGRGGGIRTFKENNISDRTIMKRSRHRNIKSLDSYDRNTSVVEQIQLQRAMFTNPRKNISISRQK